MQPAKKSSRFTGFCLSSLIVLGCGARASGCYVDEPCGLAAPSGSLPETGAIGLAEAAGLYRMGGLPEDVGGVLEEPESPLELGGGVEASQPAAPIGSNNPGTDPTAVRERRCEPEATADLHIDDQQTLDTLQGCTILVGDFTLDAFEGLDLSPLRQVREIKGSLRIRDPNLPVKTAETYQLYPDVSAISRVVPSLQALASLQEVKEIQLEGLAISNLAWLQQVRSVGQLYISQCHNLRDLQGLEQMQIRYSLNLSYNARLATLQGLGTQGDSFSVSITSNPSFTGFAGLSRLTTIDNLSLRARTLNTVDPLATLSSLSELNLYDTQLTELEGLRNLQSLSSLTVENAPRLLDIKSLVRLTNLRTLSLSETAIENFDAFPEMRSLNSLTLYANPNLIQLDGLSNLNATQHIRILHNERLDHLPVWASLDAVLQLEIVDNPALESGPSFPNLVEAHNAHFVIADNPRLTALNGFNALRDFESLKVYNNPTLASLLLPALERLLVLDLRCNPSLPNNALSGLVQRVQPILINQDDDITCSQ